MALWVDIFWVEANDQLTLRVLNPKGQTVEEHTSTLNKTEARRLVYHGSKRKGVFWDEGVYRGTALLVRETKGGKREEYTVTREVTVR